MSFNKRGQFVQVTVAIVFILLFLIVTVFVYNVGSQINDEIQSDSTLTNQSKRVNQDLTTAYPSIFDSIGAFILIGLWAGALIAAFNSDSNPFWAVLAIIIVTIIGVAGMFLSNVWDEIESNPSMTSYVTSFPMMDFILSNYLAFVLVIGFSVLVVIFTRGGGG